MLLLASTEQRQHVVFLAQEKADPIDDAILAQSWVCIDTDLYQTSHRIGGVLDPLTVGPEVLVLFNVSLSLDGCHVNSCGCQKSGLGWQDKFWNRKKRHAAV